MNVTPLIDVVMCLIIFFLIVGKLAADDAARLKLPPSAIGRGEKDASALVVTIAPDAASPLRWGGVQARVLVAGETATDARNLQELIASRGAAKIATGGGAPNDLTRMMVVIRADQGLPFAAVEPALAACAALGISKVDYATERVP